MAKLGWSVVKAVAEIAAAAVAVVVVVFFRSSHCGHGRRRRRRRRRRHRNSNSIIAATSFHGTRSNSRDADNDVGICKTTKED